MPIHRGSCHCGRVRFTVDAVIDHMRLCDCSICRRRGALLHRVGPEQFELLTGWDELTVYRWHTHQAADYFCRTCGVLPFRRPRTAPELWSINMRCLDDIDLAAVPVERVFGSRLP